MRVSEKNFDPWFDSRRLNSELCCYLSEVSISAEAGTFAGETPGPEQNKFVNRLLTIIIWRTLVRNLFVDTIVRNKLDSHSGDCNGFVSRRETLVSSSLTSSTRIWACGEVGESRRTVNPFLTGE